MTEVDRAELDAQIRRELEELERARLEALDPRDLRWLALLPEWTKALAEACEFPDAGDGLDALLRNAQAAGLCEKRHQISISGKETLRFWMPRQNRAALMEEWRKDGGRELTQDVSTLAEKLLNARGSDLPVAPEVARWAELAKREFRTAVPVGDTLREEVEKALGYDDTGTALEWIFAGEALAQPFGGALDAAVEHAKRRLNLHYRTAQDHRKLREFIERDEQIDQVLRLYESEEEWALHFIGPGGSGKTMLVSYLTSRQPEAGRATSVSRIDFDYLDPRYPLESPWQLLLELGEGLAADVEDDALLALFQSFTEKVTEAEAAKPEGGGRGALRALRTPQFERVIEAFSRFVAELPQPLLLILDTCEELAKLHPAGEGVPSIEATFEIFERVHAAAPSLRVIFAGRRWLTGEAANHAQGNAPVSVMSMKPRPYLRMHPMSGFSSEEVERYMSEVRGLELDREMIEAVLANAGRASEIPGFERAEGDKTDNRYNPMDVALLGDWLEEDPGLEPEDLAGSDLAPYVQARIIDRLGRQPEVLAAVPAAVLLRRFDMAMIEPILGDTPETRSRAFAGLTEQEWTDLEGGPDPEDVTLTVEQQLLPRLRDYYEADPERRRELEKARERLAPHLGAALEMPAGEASPQWVEHALDLLPVEEAVRRFDLLAERVAREGAWWWAEAIGSRLLSEDPEVSLPAELAPSVRALYVAALRHRHADVNVAGLWTAVARDAHLHPDLTRATVLAARGRLGALAAVADEPQALAGAAATLGELSRLLTKPGIADDVAPALLAAVEGLLDANEEYGDEIEGVAPCVEALGERFHAGPMHAYLLCLLGRAHLAGGDRADARAAFDRVERQPLEDGGEPARATGDWLPPESIRHRVLLELLRFRIADGTDSEPLLERCERASLAGDPGIDADQLLSLALQARLAKGTIEAGRLAQVEGFESSRPYEPATPAHRAAPPLFVSLAQARLAAGDARQALLLLSKREQTANERRVDEAGARAAGLAAVRVTGRLRLPERLALVSRFATAGDPVLRREGLAARALIAGLQPPEGPIAERDHSAWRVRNLLDPVGKSAVVEEALGSSEIDLQGASLDELHVALDRFEAELVQRRADGKRGEPATASSLKAEIEARLTDGGLGASPSDPLAIKGLRLAVRLAGLFETTDVPVLRETERKLLAGRLALKEGELLALRLPDRASGLLQTAERLFVKSGDTHRAFVASLRAAIADVHAGRASVARGRAKQIVARYEAAREQNDELPPVDRLSGADWSEARPLWEQPWRAWLLRLTAYLAWCGQRRELFARATLELEPELTLRPAAGTITRVLSPTRRAHTRRYGPLALAVGTVVSVPGALFLAGLTGTSFWIGVAAFFVVSVLLAVLEVVVPKFTDRFGGLLGAERLEVAIAPTHTRHGSTAEAALRVEPRARNPLLRTQIRLVTAFPRRGLDATVPASGDELAEEMPPLLAQAIKAPRVGGGQIPVSLVVTSDFAHGNWEWRLLGHLVDERWSPARAPQIWRARPSGSFRRLPTEWPRKLAAVCAPAWRPFLEASAGESVEWLPSAPDGGLAAGAARASVALGVPALMRTGWKLRVDDEGTGTAGAGEGSQVLVSPDWLVRERPIAIVVGRPGGSRPVADRSTSDGLRGFANEALMAGAHAVIAIPVLPPELSAELLRLALAEVDRWGRWPDQAQLRDLALELRSRLFRRLGERDGKNRRLHAALALDVCLFAPS